MRKLIFFILVCLAPALAHGEGPLTLERLEAHVGDSPDVRLAMSSLEAAMENAEHERLSSGVKIFASGLASTNNEPTSPTSTLVLNYNQTGSRGGLTMPLLGTWNKERSSALAADAATREADIRLIATRRANLTGLRKAFIVYWMNDRKIAALQSFLILEPSVSTATKERVRAKLMLEPERQEYLTAFDAARREVATATMLKAKSLAVIGKATGLSLDHLDAAPLLPAAQMTREALDAYVRTAHPEVNRLNDIVALRQKMRFHANFADIDTSVDVSAQNSTDYPGKPGYSAQMALNLKMPLGVFFSNPAARRASQAEVAKAEAMRDKRIGELLQGIQDVFAYRDYAAANLRSMQFRVETACDVVRVQRLRAANMPGQSFDKLHQAHYSYVIAALEALEAQSMVLQGHVDLLSLEPEMGGDAGFRGNILDLLPGAALLAKALRFDVWLHWNLTGSTIGSESQTTRSAPQSLSQGSGGDGRKSTDVEPARSAQREARASGLGFYVWNGGETLVDPRMAVRNWVQAGANRVLLSFTAKELTSFTTHSGAKRLKTMLEECRAKGVVPELLLGEPSWIFPGNRESLLSIIASLKEFPFAGLHLDLEIDQLPHAERKRREYWELYTQTLRQVADKSPWPVGVSLHPRYLEKGGVGLGALPDLAKTGVREVALMIYSTNVAAVSRRAAEIMKNQSKVSFCVAQSVEKTLPKTESHFKAGQASFARVESIINDALASPRFKGILVQSYEFWQMMRP